MKKALNRPAAAHLLVQRTQRIAFGMLAHVRWINHLTQEQFARVTDPPRIDGRFIIRILL